MKIIDPAPVADATLLSSSVPESDYAAWALGTTYAVGDRTIKTATHRKYESLVPSNLGNDPATSPAKWIDIGPTNRWAMFDQAVGTRTTATGSVTVSLAPGTTAALAVIDTDAEQVAVTMTVDGVTLYSATKTTNVSGGIIDDWYAYFTSEIGKLTALTFLDLPLYPNAHIEAVITGADPGGTVGVGTLLVGDLINIGSTEAGPSIGITDFSRKITDDYGVTTVVERPWSKRMQLRAMMATVAADGVQRRLAALRARPALYIGEEGFDSLTVYGFFKDFTIDLTLANISYCSMSVEGLI